MRTLKEESDAAMSPTPARPRQSTANRRIRAWSADDYERQEQERFERNPTPEQEAEALSWWKARFQRSNDPEIADRIARQGVGRDFTEMSLSHAQIIEDPRDPRVVLRPHRGLWSRLKQGLGMQYATSKFIKTDPKAPGRMSRWQYIQDLRKDRKE